MFVITHNNTVIFGPKNWNKNLFEEVILEDTNTIVCLPPMFSEVYSVTDSIKIYPVKFLTDPHYDQRIERLDGPFWNFKDDHVERYYNVAPLELETAKSCLKNQVSAIRYRKETSGIQHLIRNHTVSIDTSREGRRVYFESLLEMQDDEIKAWKFAEGWINISKEELKDLVLAIKKHIQVVFDWEYEKHSEIDSIQNLQDITKVEIDGSQYQL